MGIGAAVVGMIFQDERDFDDACQTSGHERVAEHGVNHGADHQMLRVTAHSPARHKYDNRGNDVSLRPPIPLPTEPNTNQTRTPPHNAHTRMLQVIGNPRSTPAVLCERVDAAPDGNDERVEELLASSCFAQPELTHQEQNGQHDTIGDESASHDEVRQALTQMVATTESERRQPSKNHLYPADHRHHLSDNSMEQHGIRSDFVLIGLLQVQLQVDAETDLDDEHQHQRRSERGVDILGELATFVRMAEEVAQDGEYSAEHLYWDVKSRASDLKGRWLLGHVHL